MARELGLFDDRGRRATTAGLIALASFAGGVVLAKAGAVGGPVLMIAAPLGLLVMAAILTRPLVGVVAVYLSFPVAFTALPLGSLDIKIVEAAAAVVTGLIVLRRLATGSTPLPWAPQMWWAFLLVGAAFVATPSSLSASDALKQDGILVVGFLFALAVLAAVRGLEDARAVVGWLLVVGTGLCAYAVQGASNLAARLGGTIVDNRIQGIFAQPNDLGAFAAMVLLLAIGLAVGARSSWSRMGAVFGGLVALVALGLSLSRGAWIGTALGLTLMAVAVPRVRRAAFSVLIPVTVLGAIALAIVLPSPPPQVQVVEERIGSFANESQNPYDDRPDIWREALREISLDPWTGVGPGNFPIASTRSESLAVTVQASHAHDVPLTVGAEAGVPAVFLLVGFTIALIAIARRATQRLPDVRDRAVVGGVGAAMAAQIGQGLVDYNLRNALIFILLWSLVGLLLVADRAVRDEDERRAGLSAAR